jgi:hypothetical protein
LELAVDEWANDEEIERMNKDERRDIYSKAQSASRAKILGATSLLTLKMNDDYVPVRMVKRGQERFVSWV